MSSKNNNMTTAKPTALLPVAAIATLAIITIQFAYAQSELPETIWFGEPDENTDMLLTEVLTQLQQDLQNRSKFNELAMRDDGEIIIYLHNGTERDFEDDITISATHNYTLENGYEFRRDAIIAPNGTQVIP